MTSARPWPMPGDAVVAHFARSGSRHPLNPALCTGEEIERLVLDVRVETADIRFRMLQRIGRRSVQAALILDTLGRGRWVPVDWLARPKGEKTP